MLKYCYARMRHSYSTSCIQGVYQHRQDQRSPSTKFAEALYGGLACDPEDDDGIEDSKMGLEKRKTEFVKAMEDNAEAVKAMVTRLTR